MRFAALFFLAVPLAAAAQPTAGSLTESDTRIAGGKYADETTLDLAEGELVRVRMESDEFDTFLQAVGPGGEELYNDDFGGTNVSQLDITALTGGRWTVRATSYAAGATGAYTLAIARRGRAEVRVVQGRLDRQDDRLIKGEFVDEVPVESDGRRPLLVQLDALGFTGFLAATAPDGTIYRSSDGDMAGGSFGMDAEFMPPTGTMIALGPLPVQRGRWRVHVTTYGPGEVGAYDLRLIQMPPDGAGD